MTERPGWTARRRCAFTLLEVLAVSLVLGLMAGLVGLSLRGVQRRVDVRQVLQRIADFDSQTRSRAGHLGIPLTLRVSESMITRSIGPEEIAGEGDDLESDLRALIVLPDRWRIDRVITADNARPPVQIRVTPSVDLFGRSASYGLRLVDRTGARWWIVVCGPTGTATILEHDEKTANEILSVLSQARLARHDAD